VIRPLVGLAAVNCLLVLLGVLVLWLAGPWQRLGWWQRVPLAALTGMATWACVAPPLLYAGLSPTPYVLLLLLAVSAIAAFVVRRRWPYGPQERQPAGGGLIAAACALPIAALVTAGAAYRPLRDFDAFTDWTFKAKMLAGHGGRLLGAFDERAFAGVPLRHTAAQVYPIGLPALEALAFRAMGGTNTRIIHVQLVLILLAFGAMAWVVLRPFVDPWLLGAAEITGILSWSLQQQTLTAYADVPLACFWVASALALGRWLARGDRTWLVLGALFAAAAAAVKQEGTAYALVLFAGAAVYLLAVHERARLVALGVAGGAVIVSIVPWRIWVAVHGITNPDIDPSPSRMANQPGAATHAVARMVDELLSRHWNGVVPIAVVAAIIAIARRRQGRLAVSYLVLLAGILGMIVLIYWNTTRPPTTLIDLTAHRLVVTPYLLSVALLPLLLQAALSRPRR
jgi:hypothetical protein